MFLRQMRNILKAERCLAKISYHSWIKLSSLLKKESKLSKKNNLPSPSPISLSVESNKFNQIKKFTESELEIKLVFGLRQADRRSIDKWYKQYYPVLYNLALNKLPDEFLAQEVVQQTFINSLKQINLFQHRSSLLSWMSAILRHEIADFYRKQYAKRAIKLVPLSELLEFKPLDHDQVALLVNLVLASLSSQEKELLLLKYVDGWRVSEIACKLGNSARSVEGKIWRARQKFKLLYGKLKVDYLI